MQQPDARRIAGILLAAGKGTRFDPSGARNKLLQPLNGNEPVATASARNLLAALPQVVAVIRPQSTALAEALDAIGCMTTECAEAGTGMAASLVHGLRYMCDADGWVIALADMPHVSPDTIAALAAAIANGADIAAPSYRGARGNPVAFSRRHLPQLLTLQGDRGARELLKAYPVVEVMVDDPGIVRDIDTPADLGGNRP
jgi:molybdenum cofactor cytidylyltransferase